MPPLVVDGLPITQPETGYSGIRQRLGQKDDITVLTVSFTPAWVLPA